MSESEKKALTTDELLDLLKERIVKLKRERGAIGGINATLMVNYGPGGRTQKILENKDDTTLSRLVQVMTYLEQQRRDLQAALAGKEKLYQGQFESKMQVIASAAGKLAGLKAKLKSAEAVVEGERLLLAHPRHSSTCCAKQTGKPDAKSCTRCMAQRDIDAAISAHDKEKGGPEE